MGVCTLSQRPAKAEVERFSAQEARSEPRGALLTAAITDGASPARMLSRHVRAAPPAAACRRGRIASAIQGGSRVVVDDLGVRLVEARSEVSLRHGQADGVGNAGAQRAWGRRRLSVALCRTRALRSVLQERTSGDLDTGGHEVLRVAGRLAAPLAELLQILELRSWGARLAARAPASRRGRRAAAAALAPGVALGAGRRACTLS